MEIFSHTIQILDLILALILVWGAYKGYQRGFVMELFSIATLIITLTLIFIIFTKGLKGLESLIGFTFPPGASFLTFLLLYLVLIFIVNKCGRYFQKQIRYSILGDFDKLAGAVVSLLKYALFLSILLNLFAFIGIKPSPKAIQETFLYSNLLALQDMAIDFVAKIIPSLESTYADLKSLFDNARHQLVK